VARGKVIHAAQRVWRAGGIDLAGDAPDMYTKPSDIALSPHLRKVGGLVRGRAVKPAGGTLDQLAPLQPALKSQRSSDQRSSG